MFEFVARLGVFQLHTEAVVVLVILVAGLDVKPKHLGMIDKIGVERDLNVIPARAAQPELLALRFVDGFGDGLICLSLNLRQLASAQLVGHGLSVRKRFFIQRYLSLFQRRLAAEKILSRNRPERKKTCDRCRRNQQCRDRYPDAESHTITRNLVIADLLRKISCSFSKPAFSLYFIFLPSSIEFYNFL